MLSLEDKDYVRQGLWLQLESARLAVMRTDAMAWQASLQRAADTLAARFEQRSGLVAGAISEIRDLQQVQVAAEMPDISAPWAQLRLLREGRAEAVVVPPEVEAEAPDVRPEAGEDATEALEDQPGDDADPGDGTE